MNTRRAITMLFVLGLLGAASFWFVRSTRSQRDASREAVEWKPYAAIEAKASAAKVSRGADEQQRLVRELTDAVMEDIAGNLAVDSRGAVAGMLLKPYKQRLMQAEVKYRSGQRQGISEANIVRLFDELVDRFEAPPYARTSEDEIRQLRLGLTHYLPDFIAQEKPAQTGSTESKPVVDPMMSPLEAAFVTALLASQKQHNEMCMLTRDERADLTTQLKKLDNDGFQLTLEERGAVAMELTKQKLDSAETPHAPAELAAYLIKNREQPAARPRAVLSAGSDSPRQEAMREVTQKMARIGVINQLQLAHEALDTLGIER